MTFDETVAFYLDRIREAVPFDVKMMLVMRKPDDPDTVLFMGDDTPEAAMEAMKYTVEHPKVDIAYDVTAGKPS